MNRDRNLDLFDCVVVSPEERRRANVFIRDGRIAEISGARRFEGPTSEIDVGGKLVMPGVVDAHVHLRDQERHTKETFVTGSRAAAVGGITTVADVCGPIPPLVSLEDLQARREAAAGRMVVDYALYAMGTPTNVPDMDALHDGGAVGFKVFMSLTGPSDDWPRLRRYCATDVDHVYRICEKAAELDALVTVHAENEPLRALFQERAEAIAPPDLRAYLRGRPPIVEEAAVYEAGLCAKATGCRLHVFHVSSAGGAEAISNLKRAGARITAETTAHNLLLTSEELVEVGALGKFSPPARTSADVAAMWQGLADGTIDIIASDHGPHEPARKREANIWTAAPGSPYLDFWPSLIFDQVAGGRLTIERAADLLCERSAKILRLYPRKGCLVPGADADLLIVDLDAVRTVDPSRFESKAKYSAFAGRRLRGVVETTVVRGRVVARGGQVVTEGGGEFLAISNGRGVR